MMVKRNVFNLLIVIMLLSVVGCGRFSRFGGREVEYSDGPEITAEGVRFSIYSIDAEKIAVAGSFNNWSKSVDFLKRLNDKGLWEITLPLSPGRYEYKFVIDGNDWISDPGNLNTVDDGFGELNSVIVVK